MLFFFPRGVLDEILNLIESVSEGFPSYFCVHGKYLRSCWDGQLTQPHFSLAGLDLLSG